MDRLVLTLLLAASPLSAQTAERTELAVLGWDGGCGVAINHLGYPRRGEAIYDEPVMARIGSIKIPAGKLKPEPRWEIAWDGANTWKPLEAKKALAELLAAGFDHRGFVETIRPEPAADKRDLDEVLRSTETLATRGPADWPAEPWRLAAIHYNRLANCALILYENGPLTRYVLTRIYNTSARPVRARAHLNNGLLLFEQGDLPGALAETGIAASLQPEEAVNRYHHAAMLSLSGRITTAIEELAEAVRLRPEYRAKAAKDLDFDNLRDIRGFRELVAEPAKGSKPRP